MESSNNYYIIQELCDSDLEKYIKENAVITEKRSIEILQQIVNGFVALIKEGIVHRYFTDYGKRYETGQYTDLQGGNENRRFWVRQEMPHQEDEELNCSRDAALHVALAAQGRALHEQVRYLGSRVYVLRVGASQDSLERRLHV